MTVEEGTNLRNSEPRNVQLPEAGKGKDIESPLGDLEGTQGYLHLDHSLV